MPIEHVQTNGLEIIIDEPRTEEQVTKENQERYIAAVAKEKQGYEARLKGLEGLGDAADKVQVAQLKEQVAACNKELGAVAEDREPRNKMAK